MKPDVTKLENCPECNTNWVDKLIPQEYWENYSPPYFYSRVIGIEHLGEDRISYFMCPDCKHHFDRSWG